LFIIMMVLGLGIKRGHWMTRLVLSVPEPNSNLFYLLLIVLIQMIGLSAFLFTDDTILNSLHAAAFGVWTGEVVKWNVSRTGNLNYSWGGYVAQLVQVGQVGAIFAAMYAIVIAKRIWSKIFCWVIWTFWTLNIFSGGRRGDMVFMMVPPIGLLFIKYQAKAAMSLAGRGIWSYVVAGAFSFLLLVIVQVEGTYRDLGLANADLSQTSLTANRGNAMFSEGLLGWRLIPDQQGFFGNRFFGEGFIRPIPEQIYLCLVGVIPRALWHDKPVDGLWEWYNRLVTGDPDGTVGTTISHGLVGSWYFHYGLGGILEGGLIVGWLMGICERSLQESNGRPMGMFVSLGMAVWLFRCYRDFEYNELYPLLAGMVVLSILVYAFRPLFGSGARADAPPLEAQPAYGASYGV
jgi:oligosaccharide repeat unit polymerase